MQKRLAIVLLLVLASACKSPDQKLVSALEVGADVDQVKKALAAGASPNVVMPDSKVPALCFSIDKEPRHADVTLALLDAGANPNAICNPPTGTTVLQKAAGDGEVVVVRALLEKGADKDAADLSGARPLYLAACAGHADAVGVLKDAGASQAGPPPMDAVACAQFKIKSGPVANRGDFEKVLTVLGASSR
ncbi:MAG TPA: ankyrin repeat domain-containing protein [Polyangiaceae bacterium]|jgi:ankyrin repeat protein